METFYSKDLIWIRENSLHPDDCVEIIKQFEEDERKNPGETMGGINTSIKNSTDLKITGLEGWENTDNLIYKSLHQALREYLDHIRSLSSAFDPFSQYSTKSAEDTGYNIQRYDTGDSPGYYNWHGDHYFGPDGLRILTFLWYLNDVDEGGETEFIDGIKVQPKAGRLVIFPAAWTYIHRGLVPISNPKWIATGWLYSRD
jgi:hypothetical protein